MISTTTNPDRLDRARFERVALAVAATLALHVGHLPPWLSVATFAAVALRVATRRRAAGAVAAWLRVPLTALLLALVAMHYSSVFGRIPGTALACGMLALKLLEAESVRDARVALAFSSFVLMSSLLFVQSLTFSVAVALVLSLVIAALVALQPSSLGGPRSIRTDLRTAGLLLAAGLPLALASFVLLPRLSAPMWGTRGDEALGSTGLSDSMTPGEFQRLVLDESPAFRAEFNGPLPGPQMLYFRAVVLTDFNGTTWTRRLMDGRPAEVKPASSGPVGFYDYTITLEGSGDQRWLPALDLPLSFPDGATLSRDWTLVAQRGTSPLRRYRLQSSTRAKATTNLSPADRDRALALPDGYGPRARQLANRWRSEFGDDAHVVQAALRLFRTSFDYTLEPPPLARDSVDDFLFGTKAGFCEHYASAFVFLMRAAGIPARVVTGYQGGWSSGEYLLVRQSDAHAWAEVWTDGVGWKRTDPTAAVSPDRIDLGAAQSDPNAGWMRSGWLRELRNEFDIANQLWAQSVITFDSLRQHALLSEFGASDLSRANLLLALAIILAFVMAAATAWAMWETRMRRGDPLDRAWQSFRARLARGGVDDRPDEGPLDLRERLLAAAPQRSREVEALIGEYVALRYGSVTPEPARMITLRRRLRAFRLPRRP